MIQSIPAWQGSSRGFISGLVLLGVMGLHVPAKGDSIVQTLEFRLNADASASVLNFAAFDGSLGTLEGVGLSFAVTRRHSWAIWNASAGASGLAYDASLTDTFFTLDGNSFGFADLHYGQGQTPLLPSTAFVDYLQQFLAGRALFLAGADPNFSPSAYQPLTTTTYIADSMVLGPLGGPLNIAYAYDPGQFSIASSDFYSGSLVDISGTATVTYTYRATAVPEAPVGLGLLMLAWMGLAVFKAQMRVDAEIADVAVRPVSLEASGSRRRRCRQSGNPTKEIVP